MYTLYYMPGACSLATHTVMNELGLDVTAIDKNGVENYAEINPSGSVPTLKSDQITLREGVSILLYLLDKYDNDLLAKDGLLRNEQIDAITFANATMHPAYGRLFFGANTITDDEARLAYFAAASEVINKLWRAVDRQVGDKKFLFGDKVSPADILLAVYSTWGQYFPVSIELGENSQRMIGNVHAMPSYKAAQEAQNAAAVAA